jgi:hypothetical protein
MIQLPSWQVQGGQGGQRFLHHPPLCGPRVGGLGLKDPKRRTYLGHLIRPLLP